MARFLIAFDFTLKHRKGSANGNAIFLSRLPGPAVEHNRSGSSSLTPVDNGGVFFIRAYGLRTRSSPTPCVGFGGLVPRPENAVSGGLPPASSDFRDCRVNGPCMRIDNFSAPSGRFAARVSAAVTTVDHRPGRGDNFPPADTACASVFAVPSEGGTGSAPSPTSTSQGDDSAAIMVRPLPLLRRLATRHLRLPCRLRAASPLGRADEHPLPLVLRRLLLIMVSRLAGPIVYPYGVLTSRHESNGRDRLCPLLRPLLLPCRLPRRYSSRPAATVPSLWELLV